MLWLILLLCLGLVGTAGYSRGPICAGFSLLGLLFGLLLAKPLSPLAAYLLPVIGLQHPLWRLFMPGVIAFVVVLAVFNIVGYVLHQKMLLLYKGREEEAIFYRWERLYHRLGLCVGLLNGAIYFFILMMPVYAGGYFTTEAAGSDLPFSARLLTRLRADLHDSHLDRVLAPHDPIPASVYEASDIIDLVLQNPPLASRLSRYPPLLALGESKEIKDLGTDTQLQQMIQSQAKVSDLLAQPKIQAIVTNATITDQIRSLLGQDLTDLQTYLNTGKSPKYDAEKILGIWKIDLGATLAGEWKRNPNFKASQYTAMRASLVPLLKGLSLTARLDNQIILKKQHPDSPENTAVAQGTWKSSGDGYEITLPGNKPDTISAAPDSDDTLHLPRDGHVLIFNKEM
jgi:uncharacterized membrane protein required for colicin V production